MAPRRVSVLGATGSVGRTTAALLAAHRDKFQVDALVAGRNVQLLAAQARDLGARLAVVADPAALQALRHELSGSGIEAAAGPDAVCEAAGRPVDLVVAAIVGTAGLLPTLTAVRSGVAVALANKECLVSAGHLFMAEVARTGAALMPVDSEHSAIFQALAGGLHDQLERIILTASGGPFRTWSYEQMRAATRSDALAHPNFAMGSKITVDSATMMNKGLELIEAHHLFDLPGERIDILVHPEQAVHGLAEFADGSMLAQLGAPDMTTPVAVALAWPRRMAAAAPRLDLAKLATLTFLEPDEKRFPALRLARQALQSGPAACCVLNAANEVAVAAFLENRIGFLDIADHVAATLDQVSGGAVATFEDLMALDSAARRCTTRQLAA